MWLGTIPPAQRCAGYRVPGREQIAIERARAAARSGRAAPAPESEVGADAIDELLAAERALELELGLATGEAEGLGEQGEPALLDG